MTSGIEPAGAGLTLSPGRRSAIRRRITTWAPRARRGHSLPWRSSNDPWHVFVSEIMLQQTGAARVAQRFDDMIAQFPTPGACAAAGQAAVVRAWVGLGYVRRAVALHNSAEIIVTRHAGAVPRSFDALVALPGVGPYTARAVLAFAHGVDVAAVDINVVRVLTRAVTGRTLVPNELQILADGLIPPGQAGPWNQALFDLGATVCTASAPDCPHCPLATLCAWRRAGSDAPDPHRKPAVQKRFEGSDRQGRGRLVAAAARGAIVSGRLASGMGWPDDARRARRVAADLVAEGVLCRDAVGAYHLA